MLLDPVTLYKDGACKKIPAIDHQAWIKAGWSLVEITPTFVSEGEKEEKKGASTSVGEEVLSEEISTIETSTPSDKKVETTKRKSLNQ